MIEVDDWVDDWVPTPLTAEQEAAVKAKAAAEASHELDRAAYKRMRGKGLRPRTIHGCAAIEAEATSDSLSWGAGMTDEQMVEWREDAARTAEMYPDA